MLPSNLPQLKVPHMSAVSNLLARRQDLLKKLDGGLPELERDEIERQITQIETALDLLDWLHEDHGKPPT